jgi:hypothetical protein
MINRGLTPFFDHQRLSLIFMEKNAILTAHTYGMRCSRKGFARLRKQLYCRIV